MYQIQGAYGGTDYVLGTFKSVAHLIRRIREYTREWNEHTKPFEWTASPDEIIAKARILHRDFEKLVANNKK